MRHNISGRKLNRTSAHRKALLSNLAQSLIEHEQIKTTLPKAKELRPFVEKLVTKAKKGKLHHRRHILSKIGNNVELAEKMMSNLANRFETRNGGYTRILKAGFRHGDNAPMALIEFVDFDANPKADAAVETVSEESKSEEKAAE